MKVLLAAAAVVAAVLAGATAGHAKNVLRWASQGDAVSADPYAINELATLAASLQVHDALVDRDSDLKLIAGLATGWRTLPDQPTVWELDLRKGVTFHDGSPFTADDVIFSLERAAHKASDMKVYISSIEAVRRIDDHRIHVVTRGPNPILPNQLTSIAIMSRVWAKKHRVEAPQDYRKGEETYAARHANGTGPFRLKLREPGVRTVLVRNENWWGWKQAGGNIDEVIYTPIRNAATRVAALLSGQVDFVLDPPFQDLDRIARHPKLKLVRKAQIRTIFFGLNLGAKELRTSNVKGRNPFADRRVREAMYRAIDIAAIRRVVMKEYSVPAGIITPPGVRGHAPELDRRLSYDPAKARALLAEAGYPNGFTVRLDCPNNRYNNDEKICVAAVAMFGRVGIRATLDARPKSKFFAMIARRQSDFYMLGWGVTTLDSHIVFRSLYHSKGPFNFTGYRNARIDELTAAMAVTADRKRRDAIVAEAWKIAKHDIVYLPLHHQVIVWGMSKKLDLPMRADDAAYFRWARLKK